MKYYKILLFFLIVSYLNCITYYERIPSIPNTKPDSKSIVKSQSSIQKPFSIEKDIPLTPGQSIGNLKFDPNSDFFKIKVEDKRKYNSDSSPFLCLLSVLTITLIPCYYHAVETVQITVTSPYFFEKRKPIEQEIRKKEYAWLPFILVIPFLGDKSPDDGNLIAVHEAESKLMSEYRLMESEIEETKKKLKPLLKNSKKYAVIVNDFATTDLNSQYSQFNFGTGRDVIIQIFNNSIKTITRIKYHLAATNSYYNSPNEVYEVIVNEEMVSPGNFTRNILYPNRNPKPNSLYLFLDKIEVEYEDGTNAVISKTGVNQVKVIAAPRLFQDILI